MIGLVYAGALVSVVGAFLLGWGLCSRTQVNRARDAASVLAAADTVSAVVASHNARAIAAATEAGQVIRALDALAVTLARVEAGQDGLVRGTEKGINLVIAAQDRLYDSLMDTGRSRSPLDRSMVGEPGDGRPMGGAFVPPL